MSKAASGPYKPYSGPYSELVEERVSRDPEYAALLLAGAMECFSQGETSVARTVIRDVIKGSLGYTELARLTGTPETSLVRMFGPSGNPTFTNVSNVIQRLLEAVGAELQVTSISRPRRSSKTARRTSAARRPKSKSSRTSKRSSTRRQSR